MWPLRLPSRAAVRKVLRSEIRIAIGPGSAIQTSPFVAASFRDHSIRELDVRVATPRAHFEGIGSSVAHIQVRIAICLDEDVISVAQAHGLRECGVDGNKGSTGLQVGDVPRPAEFRWRFA